MFRHIAVNALRTFAVKQYGHPSIVLNVFFKTVEKSISETRRKNALLVINDCAPASINTTFQPLSEVKFIRREEDTLQRQFQHESQTFECIAIVTLNLGQKTKFVFEGSDIEKLNLTATFKDFTPNF
jgi:hypothetical protein